MGHGGQVDAITAIKAHVLNMNDEQKAAFLKETGVDVSAINLMNYKVAEQYCKTHNINLESTNVWADYNKAKTDWNIFHNQYTQANKIYHTYKDQENSARMDYKRLTAQAMQKNGGEKISSSTDYAIRQQTGYTTQVIKNTNDAESVADLLLDKCYMAVDAQRSGLTKGMMDYLS